MIKKTALTFFLLMAAHAYAANWVLLTENDTEHAYIDTDSIAVNGQETKAWILYDLKKPDVIEKKTYQSAKILETHLCGQKKSGNASIEFYAGKKATGKIVRRSTLPPEIEAVPKGSPGEKIHDTVCSQKNAPAK